MKRRKITYRLYPSKEQEAAMLAMRKNHQRLYNRALEERIRVHKEEKRHLSFFDQCKQLTLWRADDETLGTMNAQSLQVTLKRVSLAFKGFFSRCKKAKDGKKTEKPGFPRFKSIERYSGWGYKTHGDGWRLLPGKDGKHGKLRLSGIGEIKIRGKGRIEGEPKTCDILYKAGKWYASITINCIPERACGTKAIGLDWGLEHFLVTHDSHEVTKQIDNPRHVRTILPKLKTAHQAISRKKKGSHNRKKSIRLLADLYAKVARRRKDFQHKEAAKLIHDNGLIAVEKLHVKAMTAKGGARKKGLNREILSTAPRQFHALLKSKAEEAGALWVEIPTRKICPSQTCYRCDTKRKKSLDERWHRCSCGANCSRDENAARVILNWALDWASGREHGLGVEPRGFAALKHETHAIPNI